MTDRIAGALGILFLGALLLIGLPFFIIYSPLYLVRLWRKRKGGDPDIYRPLPFSLPAPLARVSAWFQTEEGKGVMMIMGLATVLAASLIAVFGMGVDPIGVVIVAGAAALAVMGVLKNRPGGGG